jgi:hypothetical protein
MSLQTQGRVRNLNNCFPITFKIILLHVSYIRLKLNAWLWHGAKVSGSAIWCVVNTFKKLLSKNLGTTATHRNEVFDEIRRRISLGTN